MATYLKPSTAFDLPDEGWHQAQLTGVKNLGTCDWANDKEMIELTFRLDSRDSSGKPFEVRHAYNNSTNEAARIRIDLEAGLDRELTDDEIAGSLDVDRLVGHRFGVKVGHRVSQRGGTFSDVKALRPAEAAPPPSDTGVVADVDDDDDDLPF
ncbi:MAG: hypothetical protein ACRDQF_15930 [Thermocrispum sp.]